MNIMKYCRDCGCGFEVSAFGRHYCNTSRNKYLDKQQYSNAEIEDFLRDNNVFDDEDNEEPISGLRIRENYNPVVINNVNNVGQSTPFLGSFLHIVLMSVLGYVSVWVILFLLAVVFKK